MAPPKWAHWGKSVIERQVHSISIIFKPKSARWGGGGGVSKWWIRPFWASKLIFCREIFQEVEFDGDQKLVQRNKSDARLLRRKLRHGWRKWESMSRCGNWVQKQTLAWITFCEFNGVLGDARSGDTCNVTLGVLGTCVLKRKSPLQYYTKQKWCTYLL